MSAAQLSGFVFSSWFAGRFLRPVRRVFVIGMVLGIVANVSSAFVPTFELLAASRFVSGLSLGVATWIAWQAAFGDHDKTGDVAVVGPLVGVIASPAIAALIGWIGVDGVFLVLAVVAGSPLLFFRQIDARDRLRPHRTRHSSTRAARVILVALGVITLGGSSVFVYAAAIGHELDGLSPLTVSLMFSANSLASIPAAKWRGRRGPAGIWFLITSFCALAIALSRNDVVFSLAMITWGFVFIMGSTSAFLLLAARSNFPEERAGDAQAVMALGRVFGPLMGGALLAAGSTGTMGLVAGTLIGCASLLLLYVDRDRFLVVGSPRTAVFSRLDATRAANRSPTGA